MTCYVIKYAKAVNVNVETVFFNNNLSQQIFDMSRSIDKYESIHYYYLFNLFH